MASCATRATTLSTTGLLQASVRSDEARRFAVRFDVNVVEVIGTVVLLALMLAIGITMALAAPRQAVDCPPPSEHQVLVWAWTTDGAASCQYIDRSPVRETRQRLTKST
jgi:hypothetical protein